jgi:hypothetical protein
MWSTIQRLHVFVSDSPGRQWPHQHWWTQSPGLLHLIFLNFIRLHIWHSKAAHGSCHGEFQIASLQNVSLCSQQYITRVYFIVLYKIVCTCSLYERIISFGILICSILEQRTDSPLMSRDTKCILINFCFYFASLHMHLSSLPKQASPIPKKARKLSYILTPSLRACLNTSAEHHALCLHNIPPNK